MSESFVYEHMTPELAAYNEERSKHPGYKYETLENGRRSIEPTPESSAAVQAWKASVAELKEALAPGEIEAHSRAKTIWLCRDEAIEGEPEEHLIPSGRYKLVVTTHKTGERTWSYTKGRIYRQEDDALLHTLYRNYSRFPFCWLEDHAASGGHDYLIGGESYMGVTVAQLDGPAPHRVESYVGSWCHAAWHPSPDGSMMAADGCYWGGPYGVFIYDFAEPLLLPWPKISPQFEVESFEGWIDDTSCKLVTRRDWCIPLQKWETELTREEVDKYVFGVESDEEYDKVWDDERPAQEMTWSRPDNFSIALERAKAARDLMGHWDRLEKNWGQHGCDMDSNRQALTQRLDMVYGLVTPEQREQIERQVWPERFPSTQQEVRA